MGLDRAVARELGVQDLGPPAMLRAQLLSDLMWHVWPAAFRSEAAGHACDLHVFVRTRARQVQARAAGQLHAEGILSHIRNFASCGNFWDTRIGRTEPPLTTASTNRSSFSAVWSHAR